MFQQEGFDLGRVDVFAAYFELVFVAAQKAHAAVVADGANIAGVKPSGGVNGGGVSLRPLVVALHHGVAAHAQLPHRGGRQGIPRSRVNYLELVAGQRMAAFHTAVVNGGVEEGAGRPHAYFRHSPGRQGGAELFLRQPGHRLAAGHAHGQQDGTQAAAVCPVNIGVMAEVVEMGVKAVHHRRLFRLQQAQGFAGVKHCGQHDARAGYPGHQRAFVQPKAVEQGQVHQDDIPRRHPHPAGGVGDGADRVVAVHHSFGEAGGAAGVHQQKGVVGVDAGFPPGQRGRRRFIRAGQQRFPADGAGGPFRADDDDMAQAGERGGMQGVGIAAVQLRGNLPQHCQIVHRAGLVHHNQSGGVGMIYQVLHIPGAKAGVDGDDDGADFGDGAEQKQPLGPVGHPHGDFVARADAQADEGAGDAVGCRAELVKSPPPARVHQGFAGAVAVGGLVEQVANGLLVEPVGHRAAASGLRE